MLPIRPRWRSDLAETDWPDFIEASVQRYTSTAQSVPPDTLEVVDSTDDEVLLVLTSVDPFNADRRYRVYLRLYRESGTTCVDICNIERQ